jgi:ABC-type Fe3+ transport system permease subunit
MARILLVLVVVSILTTAVLALIYNAQSRGGTLYYMSENLMQDLELKSILGYVLPAMIVVQCISLLLGVGIGLFSSRKVGVLHYKIERWATNLKNGRLKTHLAFREEDEMKDLTLRCNSVSDTYRDIFSSISSSVGLIETATADSEKVMREARRLRAILNKLDFE